LGGSVSVHLPKGLGGANGGDSKKKAVRGSLPPDAMNKNYEAKKNMFPRRVQGQPFPHRAKTEGLAKLVRDKGGWRVKLFLSKRSENLGRGVGGKRV